MLSLRKIPFIPLLLLIACGGANAGSDTQSASEPPAPPPVAESTSADVTRYQGIDVSSFQNTVDWAAVRSTGKKFAFIKATEGIDLLDPKFTTNWKGAGGAGLVRGAYHFFEPKDDPTTQAKFFISTVQLAPGDLAPVLDVETSKGVDTETLQAKIKTWLETVESAYGITPIIYTDVNFAHEFLGSGFGSYPLWIAEYGKKPTVEGSWTSWDLWQYSESGEVDGIDGKVDLDVFGGSAARWQELLISEGSGN